MARPRKAPRAPTAADYARAAALLPHVTEKLILRAVDATVWLPSGKLWYRTRTAAGFAIFVVDPARRTRQRVFDQAKLSRALAHSAPDDDVARDVTLDTVRLSDDAWSVQFQAGLTRWQCDLKGNNCVPLAPIEADACPSPDKQREVFVRQHNLWLRDVATGRETQLTADGIEHFGYGADSSGRQHTGRACVLWSPDSKRIATIQQDERACGEMFLVRSRRGHPTLERWKYPMPCDPQIPAVHRLIIDVESGRQVRLQMPLDLVRSASWLGVAASQDGRLEAQWSADSVRLSFISVARDHRRAVLRVASASSGRVREVLEETTATFYESAPSARHALRFAEGNWRCLDARREVLWYSARSGWNHLYLYDLRTGALKHPITEGEWNVVAVVHVDERERVIYFVGVGREPGRNPYFEHLYRVGFDGEALTLLTPEDAAHDICFAPSGKYFTDTYSKPEASPVTLLRDRNGRMLMTLERADISRLVAAGWRPPVQVTVNARDGATILHGLLFKPSHFDERRSYPIVNAIYAGAILGSVIPWGRTPQWGAFAPAHGLLGDAQALAELGFIVVMIDGLGTPLRSRAFHEAYHGNYADGTLPDQVAAMTQLAQRWPWIDIERAGVYGVSGGGYRAARALFTYPGFFKVGVAIAGNHDPMSYQDEYSEKFIGLYQPAVDGTSNYDVMANMPLAKNLQGKLLLVHGMMDRNVAPYHTLLLVQALIEANKDFDLLLLPFQTHAVEAGAVGRYAIRRHWDYLVRHLLCVEPPARPSAEQIRAEDLPFAAAPDARAG